MPGLKLGKEAQAKFEEAKQSPDFAGYLEKKGAKRKNWNERWFVLKDNYLFYCKNEKSNPQGIINLHGCTVTKIEGPTARPNSYSLLAPKSVSIDAKWTNRTYFMAAKDSKECDSWLKKLDESGKKAVERAAQRKAEQAKLEAEKAAQTEKDKETKAKKETSDSGSEEEPKKKSSSDKKTKKDKKSKKDKKPKKSSSKKDVKEESKKEEPKKEEPKKEEPKKEEPKKEEPKKEEPKKEEPKKNISDSESGSDSDEEYKPQVKAEEKKVEEAKREEPKKLPDHSESESESSESNSD